MRERGLGGEGDLFAAILRFWNATPENEAEVSEDAYELLDEATALRRTSERGGSDWALARLGEGLSRLYVARQVAEWGNRSYAIQALEAAIDGLRDAVASLPPGSHPSSAEVAAFRENLLVEWRAAQSEPTLDRIVALSIPALRRGASR